MAIVKLSSLSARIDLCIYAGDDVNVKINVNNPDGTPADLTGATAKAQIRGRATDPAPIAQFLATVDPAGCVLIGLDAVTTAALPTLSVWDCQLAFAGGSPTVTLAHGGVRTLAEVTR